MAHKKNNEQMRHESHLEKLKWETAQQLGLADDLRKDPSLLSPKDAGKIGGNMVRRLIKEGEKALATEGKRITESNIRDKRGKKKK